jgi:hypothetical protein
VGTSIQTTLTQRKHAREGARAKVLQTSEHMNNIFYIIGVIVVVVVVLKLFGIW